MKHNQRYCSEDCKRKSWNTKPGRRTPKADYMTFDAISEDHSGCKIVDAPPEYLDYIGLVYNSLEYHAALEMGCLPPGVVIEHGAKRLVIQGDPTPIDFALTGKSYRHQKAVTV